MRWEWIRDDTLLGNLFSSVDIYTHHNSYFPAHDKIHAQTAHITQVISQDKWHYCNVIMGAMVSQITSLTILYSTVHWGADQIKHQSSAWLAFVRGIHRWPVISPHKGLVTRKMFPFDDVIMQREYNRLQCRWGYLNIWQIVRNLLIDDISIILKKFMQMIWCPKVEK